MRGAPVQGRVGEGGGVEHAPRFVSQSAVRVPRFVSPLARPLPFSRIFVSLDSGMAVALRRGMTDLTLAKNLAAHVLLAAVALTTAACGGADAESGDPQTTGAIGDIAEPPGLPPAQLLAADVPCVDGEIETCRVDLPSQNGIHSCFVGVQVCAGGFWSDCISEDEAEAEVETL